MSGTDIVDEDADYAWLLHSSRDAYELLALDSKSTSSVTPREIRQAYRKQALIYHPDKNKSDGAEERFREISIAYGVLVNPELKERYDSYLLKLQAKLAENAKLSEQQSQFKDTLLNEEKEFIRQLHQIKLRKLKIASLKEKSLKLRRERQRELYRPESSGNINKGYSSTLSKKSIYSLSRSVRLKWKNKQGIDNIGEDIITKLMEVFGRVESVKISSSNSSRDPYHYAIIKFESFRSCVLATLHDFSRTDSLWDRINLRRLSSLLRSCKFSSSEESKMTGKSFKKNELTFDEYVGISLLKLGSSS